MQRILLISIVLLQCFCSASGSANDSLLQQLDQTILHRRDFEDIKQKEIALQRANLESAITPEDKYNVLRDLYTHYRSYRLDSAIIIAGQRLAVARQIGATSKIASATLNLAESYAKSGNPDKAIAILDTLPVETLQDYHKKYYTSIYRTAYTSKSNTAMPVSDRLEALENLRALNEEALRQADPDSRGAYTLEAERLSNAGFYDEAVALMEQTNKKYDFSDDAAMQFTMGEIYLNAGQKDKAVECLTRSAIIDLSNCVKEYRALILLASVLFDNGDVNRAFDYINCAFEDADFSHSNLRTAEIMKLMPVIDASFHRAQTEISRRTNHFLLLAGILVVMLLTTLFFTFRVFRANRRMLKTTATLNSALETRNDILTKADALKQQHINTLMKAYTGHITRLQDFRKTILRLMITSQYDKALELVKSDETEKPDIAAFHELFDESFLSMYPDFVIRTNQFLSTPITLKTPGRLTPELRVAAMIRLGFNSSDEIASILHYSTQTVYNLRSSLRSMLSVPKQEFDAYLRKG